EYEATGRGVRDAFTERRFRAGATTNDEPSTREGTHMNPLGPTLTEQLMGNEGIGKSNTEEGRRILKDAPAQGVVFKTFADFLGVVDVPKIHQINLSTLLSVRD